MNLQEGPHPCSGHTDKLLVNLRPERPLQEQVKNDQEQFF